MYDFGANWDCSKKELDRERHFEAFFPFMLSLFSGVCSDHDKIIGRWISNLLSLSVEFLKKTSSCWHWALCGTAVARRRHWAGAEAKLRQHCLQMLPALLDPRTLFYHFHFLGAFSCLVPFYFLYFQVRGQVQMLPSGPQNLVSRSLLFITFTLLQPFPCIVALEVMIALI